MRILKRTGGCLISVVNYPLAIDEPNHKVSHFIACKCRDGLGLYGQVTKRARWMPWHLEAMKDVVACDKFRGGGKQPLIRKSLNGETHLS